MAFFIGVLTIFSVASCSSGQSDSEKAAAYDEAGNSVATSCLDRFGEYANEKKAETSRAVAFQSSTLDGAFIYKMSGSDVLVVLLKISASFTYDGFPKTSEVYCMESKDAVKKDDYPWLSDTSVFSTMGYYNDRSAEIEKGGLSKGKALDLTLLNGYLQGLAAKY